MIFTTNDGLIHKNHLNDLRFTNSNFQTFQRGKIFQIVLAETIQQTQVF